MNNVYLSKDEIEEIIKCIEFTDSNFGSDNSEIIKKLKSYLTIDELKE